MVAYKTVKGINAADHALDAYKSTKAMDILKQTEAGIYGLTAANGFGEAATGKDMFGNTLTDEQRQNSLMNALGITVVGGAAKAVDKMASGSKLIPHSKEYVQNQVQKAQGSIKDMAKSIGKTEVPTGFKLREVADTTGSTHKMIDVDKTTIKDLAQKITAKGEGSKGAGEVSKKISDVPHLKGAKAVIAERTKGLDLKEHPTTTKQMSSKKMKELKEKVDNRTITKQEYADYIWNKKFAKTRDKGVKQFWYQEQQRILNNEPLTREWSQEQVKDILNGKTPKFDGKAIAGHHSYSASKFPHLADKGEIIYPVTFREHFKGWHGGNWKNSIPGEPIKPIKDF